MQVEEQDKSAVELVNVSKRFGEVAAVDDVNLSIGEGEFFSLLGPSGCGKTTTLRMIAGFEHPTGGEIYIEGVPVAGVPPFRRNVNTVFQSYALFPHMSVAENVSFGLEATHAGSKAEIAARVQRALDLVRLGNYGKRRPRQMSGGQQQRVALARALVNRPAVLLLDEPLGALDLKLRKEMQLELKNLQTQVGITFIYVTHDQEEALTMSDRIAVMSSGKVLQVGSPAEIYERPNCRFVADFIGQSNFLHGQVAAVGSELVSVTVGEEGSGLTVRSPRVDGVQTGSAVTLAVRPEKINLSRIEDAHETGSNGLNRAVGRIKQAIYMGTTTQYLVDLPGAVSITVERQNGGVASANDTPGYRDGQLLAPTDSGRFVEHEEVLLEWSPAVTLLLES
jgi:spermidine/putrescine transport system ATP-binding protein